jgi:hypothetical protein
MIAILMAVVAISVIILSAQPAHEDIAFPNGFRDWFAVNSMVVTKDSVPFSPIAGMHFIYVNAKGRATLEKGGPFPYPDGTMFADDVHEFSEIDGSYVEGRKKAVTVMVTDARKYAATGGWGFQAWANGTLRSLSSTTPLNLSLPVCPATLHERNRITYTRPISLDLWHRSDRHPRASAALGRGGDITRT